MSTLTTSTISAQTSLPSTVEALNLMNSTEVNSLYRPFLILKPSSLADGEGEGEREREAEGEKDWIEELELDTVLKMSLERKEKLKILVLYGSLRSRSYSRLTAFEVSRILMKLNVDVRVFNPLGLPMKDEISDKHEKVLELRALSEWSDGQFWVSPEQHGTITAVFKNQIDWIPLSLGSVRPTQGRTLALAQVNGGSQSFNTVNLLRQLGRWMRMFVIPNQSSIPQAWKMFTDGDSSNNGSITEGRMKKGSNRDRLVDCCEELVKVSCLLVPVRALLDDRYSEREEKREFGRLRSQEEVIRLKELEGMKASASAGGSS